jgi:hypothetical protein
VDIKDECPYWRGIAKPILKPKSSYSRIRVMSVEKKIVSILPVF